MSKHHHNPKIKIVYREKSAPDLEKRAREEIDSLEKQKQANMAKAEMQKAAQGSKFGKFVTGVQFGLGRMNIQKEINARQQFLRGKQAVRNINTRVEVETAKDKLKELQKKNALTWDSLQGGIGGSNKKQVKFEDLF